MFKSIRIITRPNREIPFFNEVYTAANKERQMVYYEKYIKTGKSLKSYVSLSDDKLTATQITEWNSKEDFVEFCTDATPIHSEWRERLGQYLENNGFLSDLLIEDSVATENFYLQPHIFVVFRPGAAGNFLSSMIDNLSLKKLDNISLSNGGHAHYNSIVERKKFGIDYIALGNGIIGVDRQFLTDEDKLNYYKEKIDSANYENRSYVTWSHDFTNIPLYKKLFPACKILVIKEDTFRQRLISMIMAINKNHFRDDQQIPLIPADRVKPIIYKKTFISTVFSRYYPEKTYKEGYIDLDKHIMYQSHLFCQGLGNYDKTLLDSNIPYIDDNTNPNLTFIERRAQHSIGFNFSEFADEYVSFNDILTANPENILISIENILDRELTMEEKEYARKSLGNYKESQDQTLLEDPLTYLDIAKEKADKIMSAI